MGIKGFIKRLSLPFLFLKDRWIGKHEKYMLSGITSMAIFVGPYRNLTTYWASILSVHPACKVLNHAGIRVFNYPDINFLTDYSHEKYDQFLGFANYAEKTGYKGRRGGSIIHSHAFESTPELLELYLKNRNFPKTCVAWKESQEVSNILIQHNMNIDSMLSENEAIQFIFPVRNPIDCAVSNLKTGKYKQFARIPQPDLENILQTIFIQYLFFLELSQRHNSRVLFLFEHHDLENNLNKLIQFLNLKGDEEWHSFCLKHFKLKKGYDHSTQIKAWFKEEVAHQFDAYPLFRDELFKFV